jgi:hypothetical protein
MLTHQRLRSYLTWAVHGRKPARLPASKPRNGPPRDEAYKAWIRTLPCSACGIEGRSEASHTGSDGGMSMKAEDYSCVPLCSNCHTQAPGAYHRIGKRAFERAHGVCFAVEVRRLNAAWKA